MTTIELKQHLHQEIESLSENELKVIDKLLDELKIKRQSQMKPRTFGSMKGLVIGGKLPNDFNEPLEDFKEYMY
jgi:hypothetical protein